MTEPRTAAGKRLAADMAGYPWAFYAAICAIEDEAWEESWKESTIGRDAEVAEATASLRAAIDAHVADVRARHVEDERLMIHPHCLDCYRGWPCPDIVSVERLEATRGIKYPVGADDVHRADAILGREP